jgi:hypothetical protein
VTREKSRSTAVVTIRIPPDAPDPTLDPRLSDVDEWGRSERFRALVRAVYEPVYARWFRVEWEGLEKIPTAGGALLVANHAGAIPSDAPVIMHGIETELERPVYGLADSFFRTVPVVGTLWAVVRPAGRDGGPPPLRPWRRHPSAGATGFEYHATSAGAVQSFIRAVRLRRGAGKTPSSYTYEHDIEQFFRHSPSVTGNADR